MKKGGHHRLLVIQFAKISDVPFLSTMEEESGTGPALEE
jgi:hypothetical protein